MRLCRYKNGLLSLNFDRKVLSLAMHRNRLLADPDLSFSLYSGCWEELAQTASVGRVTGTI